MPDAELDKEPEGNKQAEEETKPEESSSSTPTSKTRSVSFNRDVHVKRIAPNRTASGPPGGDGVRRQPLAGLSQKALAQEAAKVLAQASSIRCSSSSSPEKFFSLPTRKKHKPDAQLLAPPLRRRSEELGITTELPAKTLRSSLNRSTSDVTAKKHRRNSNNTLLNLFKRPDKDSNQPAHHQEQTTSTTKNPTVKRSKSDVSDLKSSSIRAIRKRTGSESEEYLNSVIGKKSQLSPIIEINQADDYFKSKPDNEQSERVTPEAHQPPKVNSYKVNPIEKPPRTKDPKPPARSKRIKEDRPKVRKHFDTLPKSKSGVQKRLLVDEVDNAKTPIKRSIKDTIDLIEHSLNEEKPSDMIHSSQKPPEKLPLTKGQAVDSMVKFLNQDKYSPPPKTITSSSTAAHNNNQPFSYTKPTSVSPDPNLYARSLSPDRAPSPINKMNQDSNRGIIYAQVVCGDNGVRGGSKQTIHTSVPREKFGHNSDEDEGLGYEDTRMKYRDQTDYAYGNFDDTSYHVKDSPITPRFKEFRNHKFVGDELEYENEYPSNDYDLKDLRGRGDGMDARRRESLAEPDDLRYDKKLELSYRRELLENRFNARKNRDQTSPGNTRYTPEKDFIEEASPIETTRQYVNETSARYFKDNENVVGGFSEKYTSEVKKERDGTLTRSENRSKSKFNPTTNMFEPVSAKELDRREFIDRRLAEEPRETKYFSQKPARFFPPEPDYEPPSLDSQASGPRYSPEDRKYKKAYTSSQDGLNSTSRYKHKHEKFGNNRDHYASNPEIAQKRAEAFTEARDEYDPARPETYHNSLRRQRHNKSDKHYRMSDDYLEQTSSRSLRQQDSSHKKDYGEEMSGPESSRSRYDNDRDRDNKFADSGIENDYRKDSNGDIHSRGAVPLSSKDYHGRKSKNEPRNESEDEGFASSLLIASERQHTEDNCSPVKGKYNLDGMDYRRSAARRDEFIHRERSIDDGSFYDPRLDKFEERTTLHRVDAKPPKAVKKISGLEKMKQLFSRDSSKKSKKDKDKYKANETRVRDNNGMVKEEDLRRRYTEYRGSSEDLDVIDSRRGRLSKNSDLESETRNSVSIIRNSRTSKYRDDEDSSAMDFDYSQRRRMATPSPSPSPPRRPVEKPTVQRKDTPRKPLVSSTNGWFKSLDRLSKSKSKTSKVEKDSVLTTTEEESNFTPKRYTPNSSKAPTKSLRFFGDTDQESNSSSKNQSTLRKRSSNAGAKIEPQNRTLTRNGKSLSNSVHALDRTERYDGHRSSSLTNLQNGMDSRQTLLANSYNKEKYNGNRRDLHNISEIHSNSETESQFEEREKYYKENGRDHKKGSDALKSDRKPPMSPLTLKDKRRSRSHSAPKISKSTPKTYHGSRGDLVDENRTYLSELHTSKNDLRGSKHEIMGSKSELRSRRRRAPAAGATSPADSSTEGDSSHQSQRSIVYLHAATVGDIPSKGRISRGKSRDDVSSVNSSLTPHVKTVSRSFSVLAPWKPRHFREGQDINYSQSGHQSTMKRSEKSSRTSTPVKSESSTFGFNKNKSNSTRNLTSSKYDVRPSEERSIPNKSGSSTLTRHLNKTDDRKKSTSSSTLNRKTEKSKSGHSSSKENLGSQHFNTLTKSRNDLRDRNYKKSMSTEVLSRESPPKGTKRSSIEREKLARSISMPKDPNKSAGWFRIPKKSKKIENPSRVY